MTSDSGANDKLEVLLAEYSSVSQAENSFFQALVGLTAALVAFLGIVAAITERCSDKPLCDISHPLVAAAPLPSIALLALVVSLGERATLRSYYLRDIEADLRRLAGLSESPHGLRGLRYFTLDARAASLGSSKHSSRLAWLLVFAGSILIFGGTTAFLSFRVGQPWQLAMQTCYGIVGLALIAKAWTASQNGRRLYDRTLPASDDPSLLRKEPVKVERSLDSYILLPRPFDLVKLPIIPAVAGISALAYSAEVNWGKVVVATVVFELLFYQARYQLNDVRGIQEDGSHADASRRLRLPIGSAIDSAVAWSLSSAAVRVILGFWIAYTIFPDVGLPRVFVLTMFVSVLVPGLLYEWSRTIAQRNAGVGGVLVLLGVGVGYSVRCAIGVDLVMGTSKPSLLASFTLFGFMYGCMFVHMTWALEAAAGSTWSASSLTDSKPHLGVLGRQIERQATEAAGEGVTEWSRVPALRKRGRVPSVWNASILASSLASGLLGGVLAGRGPGTWVATGILMGAALVFAEGWMRGVLGAAPIGALMFVSPEGLIAAAPLLVTAATCVIFRRCSYSDLTPDPRLVLVWWQRFLSWVVGARTARLLAEAGK